MKFRKNLHAINKWLIAVVAATIIFSSCQKEIRPELNEESQKQKI